MSQVIQTLRNRRLLRSTSIPVLLKAVLFVGGFLLPAYMLYVWLLAPEGFFVSLPDSSVMTVEVDEVNKPYHLGNARETYVINLPHHMEQLRTALDINWDYVNGVYLNSSLVRNTLEWVHTVRSGPPHVVGDEEKPSKADEISFTWPTDIDALATANSGLDLWSSGNGVWPLPPAVPKELPPYLQPMASSTENYNIATNVSAQPQHLLLTEARVACWFGHLDLIHKIANSLKDDEFAIILEDDVDMERDTDEQMKNLWSYLPADWDMVFLGHCCSDESRGQRISPGPPDLSNDDSAPQSSHSQLHASSAPQCTHAYALSRTGARRLLLHLRYPPFAFSRAIDQAISWLIYTNRIKSYSAVPALIVQRRISNSDITEGIGFWQKDKLVSSVFDDRGKGKMMKRKAIPFHRKNRHRVKHT
ncbi:hypothetical protein M413DRAFT_445011 [Hebeloma cylindrosporum]|uniref:Glycosyl transferase family 25 domain-containing protein n=1 Tax=Hebeloma cylindrosporum TaxID=76867 RepID=A0A0C3BYW9_HEBCY|nr:hypothetical protein M413DRAFT_445011 [Hebeloma cylindrosporum h7]